MLTSLFSRTKQDCAIVISYFGTTKRVVDAISILNKQNVLTILVTGLGNNDIKEKASHVIHMTTREKLFSKIGNFTTERFPFILYLIYYIYVILLKIIMKIGIYASILLIKLNNIDCPKIR